MSISAKFQAPALKNVIEREICLTQQLYGGVLPSLKNRCNKESFQKMHFPLYTRKGKIILRV